MDVGVLPNLQSKINNICDTLSAANKLITTKTVVAVLSESLEHPVDFSLEERITKIINLWRLSRVQKSVDVIPSAIESVVNRDYKIDYHKICRKFSKCSKQLIKAKREIQFLKAKIRALNSFYNRQRQEFIMRIEGMLYK